MGTDWDGWKHHRNTGTWTELTVSQWNSRVNSFPGFNSLQLSQEVKDLSESKWDTREFFTGRINFMTIFNDISWGIKRQWKRSESIAWLVSLNASRFGTGQWSFLGLGSEKKWSSISEDSPQGDWDNVGEDDVDIRRKRDIQSSMPRVHCAEVRLKSKDGGKLSIHCFADLGTVKTVLSQIISVKQLCFDGAVVEMCE